MTAGQHQSAASAEERAAAQHQAQYNPAAPEAPMAPSPGSYSACISYENSNCYVRWQSEANPTDRHRKDAEHHRQLAEKHRAASQALRDAEQRFCAGIPQADRDLSPFYHREDITAVEGAKKGSGGGDGYLDPAPSFVRIQHIEKEVLGTDLLGARITFRAVPGMTGEWLQRVVDCHLARNAVVGAADETMSFCPLAVPHVTARVMSTGSGFSVDVTSETADSALQVVRRAQALGPTGPAVEK
jgi:hypothetical protein